MVTFKAKKPKPTEYEEVEIPLPFYCTHGDSVEATSWDVYVKIDEHGTVHSVTERSQPNMTAWEYERFEYGLHGLFSGQHLGRYVIYDPLTPEAFEAKLADFTVFLAGLTAKGE